MHEEKSSLNERVALAGVQFVEVEIAAATSTIEFCRTAAMTSKRSEFLYAQNALDLGWRVLQSLILPEVERTKLQTRINSLYEQLDALAATALKPGPAMGPAYPGLFRRPIPIDKGR